MKHVIDHEFGVRVVGYTQFKNGSIKHWRGEWLRGKFVLQPGHAISAINVQKIETDMTAKVYETKGDTHARG